MPGRPATAVATVTQQPQAQQQEMTPASSSSGQSDNDQVCSKMIWGDLGTAFIPLHRFMFLLLCHQVQNLAMRGVSSSKGVGVKTEAPERSDSGSGSKF